MPSVAIASSRPASRSPATASALSTAGPSPRRAAARIAEVDPSSSRDRKPPHGRSPSSRISRVPDPASRTISSVPASSLPVTGEVRRAHGWAGSTTTTSRSLRSTTLRIPGSRCWCPSTKPTSARPSRTRASTFAELVTSTAKITSGDSRCRAASQPGSRCSATVSDAATRRCELSAATSASMPAIMARVSFSTRRLRATTRSPAGVSRVPDGARRSKLTPSRRSSWLMRMLTAGCDKPCRLAAWPRLPSSAMESSRSSAVRSGVDGGSTHPD
jgi:hypothetical protein